MLIKVEYNSVDSHAYWGRLCLYKGRLQQSKIILLKYITVLNKLLMLIKPHHNDAYLARCEWIQC